MTSREIIWQTNFEELKSYVAQTGHFPGKHTRLNNWCRYQRKRIEAGLMPEDQRAQLFSFSQPDIASI